MRQVVTTLGERLVLTQHRPAGFDWMRLLLASGIVVFHTIVTSYGDDVQNAFWLDPVWRPPLASILGMFFALSGFLVAGSLERCRTLISFAGLRIMRIFPALVVEVLLSAFVLGPLLTRASPAEYVGDVQFRHYLLNILGLVHYTLPGLFVDNPLPRIVNGQLWTVPYELVCYEALIAIAILNCYINSWRLLGCDCARRDLAYVAGMLLRLRISGGASRQRSRVLLSDRRFLVSV